MRWIGRGVAVVAMLSLTATASASTTYVDLYGKHAAKVRARTEQALTEPGARARFIKAAGIVDGIGRRKAARIWDERPELIGALGTAVKDGRGHLIVGCLAAGPCIEQPAVGAGLQIAAAAPAEQADVGADPQVHGNWVTVDSDSYHVGSASENEPDQFADEDTWLKTAYGRNLTGGALLGYEERCKTPKPSKYIKESWLGFDMYKLFVEYSRFCWNINGFTQYGSFSAVCVEGGFNAIFIECGTPQLMTPRKGTLQAPAGTLVEHPGAKYVHRGGAHFKVKREIKGVTDFRHTWRLRLVCKGDGSCWRGRKQY